MNGQGSDLIAGSLIKNPGGTIAPCGGYIAGRKKWVEAAAARLSAPGLGVDCGSTPGDIMRAFFQGLFLSPQMVGEAIKVSYFSPCSFIHMFFCYLCLAMMDSHISPFLNLYYKGSFLIAEVMAAKGYKVQPLCRVKRHDTVQVGLSNFEINININF